MRAMDADRQVILYCKRMGAVNLSTDGGSKGHYRWEMSEGRGTTVSTIYVLLGL